MQYRLGIDIGGTFTDFVAFDEANRELKAWKNLSTPRDPIEGVMTGLKTFGATGSTFATCRSSVAVIAAITMISPG